MKFLYQTHSPYARKVLVFAHEVGLASQIQVVHHETSPVVQNPEVFAVNPLGKVPVLVRPGQEPLFDSDVICAYLDSLHRGPRLIPESGEARWHALQWQAVAQGLCEAGIAIRWESVRRPVQLRYKPLQGGYEEKLLSSYAWLENRIDSAPPMHVGHIAVASALSWIEFRHLVDFRSRASRLTRWFDVFQQRASMQAIQLSGDTVDVTNADS